MARTAKNPWIAGTIGIPDGSGKFGHLIGVHYTAKVYDEGSEYGINGGRISKLTLSIDGRVVYNYDRGEDIPPQNEAAEKALAILLAEYERPKQTPEWPENLGDEDLVNDYRASLMLGNAELTEALRWEILRRMRGPEF